MNQNRLSEQIRLYRKQKGITQAELATLLGLSEMTVRRWESGRTSPRIEEIQNIAKALQIPASDLLDSQNASPVDVSAQDSNKRIFTNTGYSLVYERNGERMELPPTEESYAIFRDIAARIASREIAPAVMV